MNTPRSALVLLLAAGVVTSACASRPTRVRVLPPRTAGDLGAPPPDEAAPDPEASRRAAGAAAAGDAVARTAESLLGLPYREGGALPDGFDCSGLAHYVFARQGVAVPRDVRRLASTGAAVAREAITPGDLVFFSTTGSGPTHVGIAIGGNRFIHAPKRGDVVRIEWMTAGYWTARFVTARRISVP